MIIGTNHFVSLSDTVYYYSTQEIGRKEVLRKLDQKEIAIGRPTLKGSQSIVLLDEGTRYGILDMDVK